MVLQWSKWGCCCNGASGGVVVGTNALQITGGDRCHQCLVFCVYVSTSACCCGVAGIACFGPSAAAAEIEASKDFAKQFMSRQGIPTARFQSFTDPEEACKHING